MSWGWGQAVRNWCTRCKSTTCHHVPQWSPQLAESHALLTPHDLPHSFSYCPATAEHTGCLLHPTAFNISCRIRTYIMEKTRNFMDHMLAKMFVSSQNYYTRWGMLKSNLWSLGTDGKYSALSACKCLPINPPASSEGLISGSYSERTTGFISLDLFYMRTTIQPGKIK